MNYPRNKTEERKQDAFENLGTFLGYCISPFLIAFIVMFWNHVWKQYDLTYISCCVISVGIMFTNYVNKWMRHLMGFFSCLTLTIQILYWVGIVKHLPIFK